MWYITRSIEPKLDHVPIVGPAWVRKLLNFNTDVTAQVGLLTYNGVFDHVLHVRPTVYNVLQIRESSSSIPGSPISEITTWVRERARYIALRFKNGLIKVPSSVTLLLPSATKLRRLCFYRCVSVHGGVLSQHALQVVFPACLAAGLQGGRYPSMPCRFPGPHPREKFRGICLGGSPGPHPRGKFRGIYLRGRGCLLRGGCLLLEGACFWGVPAPGGCLLLGGGVWCALLLWPSGLVAFWLKVAFWYGLLGRCPTLSTRRPYQKATTEDHFQPEDHTRRPPSIRRPPNQKAITEDHNRRPWQKTTPPPHPNPSRRLLLQTVRILLEFAFLFHRKIATLS